MIDKNQIKKILILRYRFIGDTVLTIPFIKNVRENFPNVQIDVLVSPNSGELLENNPDIKNVIYFDNTKFHKYESIDTVNRIPRTIYNSFFSCAAALRKEKYDLTFVLKRSFSSAFLSALAGIKYRIGFNTELRSFLLTHPVKYDKEIHELDNFLNCLKVLDINPKKYIPEFFPSQSEAVRANGFLVRLDRFKPKILIHASSAHPYKQWPKRYFAKLMDKSTKKILGAHIIGPEASNLIHELVVAMQNDLTVDKIIDSVHAHPTYSEVVFEALEDCLGEAVHV